MTIGTDQGAPAPTSDPQSAPAAPEAPSVGFSRPPGSIVAHTYTDRRLGRVTEYGILLSVTPERDEVVKNSVTGEVKTITIPEEAVIARLTDISHPIPTADLR